MLIFSWISVPTASRASARVRLPGTNPLMMRMLLTSIARVNSSSTMGSIGRVRNRVAINRHKRFRSDRTRL